MIESFNKHWDSLSKEFKTYMGKDMDRMAAQKIHKVTRKEVNQFGTSKTLPTWQAFIEAVNDYVAEYNNRPQSSLPKTDDPETGKIRHMTPNEMWEHAIEVNEFEPIVVSDDEADDLFRPYEVRTVTRCMLSLHSNSYFAIELEQFNGDKVAVGYDMHDSSQTWIREIVKTRDGVELGRLICIAKFEGNKQRYIPLSMERKAMETRAKGRKKLLDGHLAEVEQELNPNIYLEAAEEKPMKIFDSKQPVPEKAPIIIDHTPEKLKEVKPIVRMNKNGFPIFSHFTDKMFFFMENPEKLTDHYYKLIKRDLNSVTKRDIMDARGMDIDLIGEILSSYAATMERKVA